MRKIKLKKSIFRYLKAGRTADFKAGEIVTLRSRINFFPETTFKVERVSGEMIFLSAGEVKMGVSPQTVEVIKRNATPPIFWEEEEVKILRANVKSCDCPDCRKSLESKEQKLSDLMRVAA